MGQITPNISIYIPSAGETNYDASFLNGMINIDQHDHSGPPNKGVPIASSGLADGSVTAIKLNANVVDPGEGLAVSGGNPNALQAAGVLNSIYKLAGNGMISKTGASSAATRTITGTINQIALSNGDGILGDPTISLSPIVTNATQPAFFAYLAATQSGVTGDSSSYTVPIANTILNQGSYFSTINYDFTAPVTGNYFLSASVLFNGNGNSTINFNVAIVCTTTTITEREDVATDGNNVEQVMATGIIPMSAGDTAYISVQAVGSATKTTDVIGGNAPYVTYSQDTWFAKRRKI